MVLSCIETPSLVFLLTGDEQEAEEGANPDTEDVDTDKLETATSDVIIPELPADCCPDCCYTRFATCCCYDESKPLWLKYKIIRTKVFALVENKYFETVVVVLILTSSLALVSDRPTFTGIPSFQITLTAKECPVTCCLLSYLGDAVAILQMRTPVNYHARFSQPLMGAKFKLRFNTLKSIRRKCFT